MMEQAERGSFPARTKNLLLCVALLASAAGMYWIRSSFDSPLLYQKDFVSGFLLAKALLNGSDPYVSLRELSATWMPETDLHKFNHPSPHTIAIGWLCAPFTLLPYESAARAWLIFELGCLLGSILLLERALGLNWGWRARLGVLVLALGWAPVMQDLWFGQFSLVLLVLLLGAWLALRQGQDWRGGVWLGCMVTLKLTGWPIVLFLLWRRRWTAVWSAGLTVVALHGLQVALHGWTLVSDYYLKIGPQVSAHYRLRDPNASLWTFGQRLFAEFGNNFLSQPPWPSPGLARLVNVAVPLLVLGVSFWLAGQLRNFDAAFALLACVSAVINPVAWTHYLLWTVPAVGLLLQRLQVLGWPRSWLTRLMLICAPFCVTHPIWSLLVLAFSHEGLSATRPVVPFAAAWLSVTPTIAVLVLCWMVWRLMRFAEVSVSITQSDIESVTFESAKPSAV